MRPAAGVAPGREAIDAELVEQLRDVRGGVRDRAAGLGRGAGVAGAVVADQADPASPGVVGERRVEPPGGRRAVVDDDRDAVRIALVVDVQRPAVGETDVELAHSPGRSGVPGRPSGKSSASRRATGFGTSSETSPPNAAISFTPLEETKLTCGLAMT